MTLALAVFAAGSRAATAPLDSTLSQEARRSLQREALLAIELLQGYHYSDRPFHELDAKEFLDTYLKALDGDHLMLTAGDVDFIHHRFERNLKTVYLFKGDLHPAFEIYDLFSKRVGERWKWINQRLEKEFDLTVDGKISVDRKEAAWPAEGDEANGLWERWLKREMIGELLKGRTREEAVADLKHRYDQMRKRVQEMDPLRIREQFLSTLLELFDPHSGYFSHESASEFEITMSGAVSGAGVDLRLTNGHFVVQALQPGGPAEKSGLILPGDEIMAVAEEGAAPQSIAGWKLREVVQRIRGQPGSKLSLTLKARDQTGPPVITLERARIEMAADHANARIFTIPGPGRPVAIGVIFLPAFYGENEGTTEVASMTRDVRELLGKLSSHGVEGVVIDLRDNGGGLLNEAVNLSHLFAGGGPMVLVRGLDGKIVPVEATGKDPVAYPGPLVVLTSHRSASASEVFAGAMQAYRRAVIVGADATFGKGTAQDYMDLRTMIRGMTPEQVADWGMARITRQRFYLPDGNTSQQKGIHTDIALPWFDFPDFKAEKDLPHALPWESVPAPARPAPPPGVELVSAGLLEKLQAASRERRQTLPEFDLRGRALAYFEHWWKQKEYSLQLEVRRQERDAEDREGEALRKERHALEAEAGYPTEGVDLQVVTDTNQRHQAALRARKRPDGTPWVNHFVQGTFYYETTPGGRIRDIPVETIDLEVCMAETGALAEAWLKSTTQVLAPDRVRAILADLKSRQDSSAEEAETGVNDIAEIFQKHLEKPLEPPALSAGLDAFFKQAIEIDGDVLQDYTPLDVNLRESIRIASDWARAVESKK